MSFGVLLGSSWGPVGDSLGGALGGLFEGSLCGSLCGIFGVYQTEMSNKDVMSQAEDKMMK